MGVKSLNTFRATQELKNEHNRTIHSVHPFNHSVFKSLASTTLSGVFSYLRMPPALTWEGSGHLPVPVAQWVSMFALEHLMNVQDRPVLNATHQMCRVYTVMQMSEK